MNQKRLIEAVEVELASLDILYRDIVDFPNVLNGRQPNNYDKSAIALMISQFYNGIENILKRVLDYHGIKILQNDRYHVEIIASFTAIEENNLPVIFSEDIIDGFSILRRFRHYVFHGYSFRLEYDRLEIAINALPALYMKFNENLKNYLDDFNS